MSIIVGSQCESIPLSEKDFSQQRERRNLIAASFKALKPYVHPLGIGRKFDGVPKPLISKNRRVKHDLGLIPHRCYYKDSFKRGHLADHLKALIHYYTSRPDAGLCYLDIDPEGHESHRKHGTPYTEAQLRDAAECKQWLLSQAGRYIFEDADGRLFIKWRGIFSREVWKHLAKALNRASGKRATIEIKGTQHTQTNSGCLARLPLFTDISQVEDFNAKPVANEAWFVGWTETLREQEKPQEQQFKREYSCTFDIDVKATAYDRYFEHCPKKVNDIRILKKDFDTAVALCEFCRENPLPDGGMPYTRIEYLWNLLHDEGKTPHRFNNHRWKAIRDTLSSLGLIEWQDNRHCVGGSEHGRACRWHLKDLDTQEQIRVEGVCVRPVFVSVWTYHNESEKVVFKTFDMEQVEKQLEAVFAA